MRLLLWLCVAVCVAVVQHALLSTLPAAPDLPLAIAAWAVVVGGADAWMWRVWLAGAVRDQLDPGSLWFHAGAHLVLVLLLLPLRRWLPEVRWLALLAAGAGMSLAVQGLDVLAGGMGGWQWWSGLLSALLTGGAAVVAGRLAPGRKRTVTVEDEEPPAGDQPTAPERSTGSATPA